MPDLFRLDEKVVAVIGAGSGIGEAVALGAASQGARVECLDVNAEAAHATAMHIRTAGGQANATALDIVDAQATNAALQRIAAERGRLDGLVCTPSINVRKKLLDYAEEEFDRVPVGQLPVQRGRAMLTKLVAPLNWSLATEN